MEIAVRLEQLERRYRTLQACTALLLIAMAGLVLSAQTRAPAKEVAARSFVLVDAKGETVGQWGVFAGRPGFSLWAGGEPKFVVATGVDNQTVMSLAAPKGMSLMLGSAKEATAMWFVDKNGKHLGSVGVDDAGRFYSGASR